MDTIMEGLARGLIFFGLLLAALGALILIAGRIPFLGQLPGDIVLKRRGFTFYFPIVTSVLLSLLLTLALNLWLRIGHK